MQVAFRVQTDAAILGAGGVIKTKMSRIRPSKGLDDFIPSGSLRTVAADTYPAAPETPASPDKLIQPFSRQNTECVPWFASFCRSKTILWTFADSGLRCHITIPTSGESERFFSMTRRHGFYGGRTSTGF